MTAHGGAGDGQEYRLEALIASDRGKGMEEIKKSVWEYAKDSKLNEIVEKSKKYAENEGRGLSAVTTNQSQLLLPRSSRRVVSLWTCSKLCGVCFIGGILVGYTLKRRVRRWASRLLKWIKDD